MASSSQGRHKVGVSIRRIVAHLSRCYPRSIERDTAMAERTADVQAHWTRPGVLARIDAALTELGHNPQNLTPEILATVEHLHSGGLATTRDQAERIAVTEESQVLDVGCGIGGPARYLAHRYGCRVDAPAPVSNSFALGDGRRSGRELASRGLWRRTAPLRFAHACPWTCQNSSQSRRRNIAPPPPKPRGGRRALAGERSKRSGSLAVTTTHALLAGKVQRNVRHGIAQMGRRRIISGSAEILAMSAMPR
jgi:hypothetical protein